MVSFAPLQPSPQPSPRSTGAREQNIRKSEFLFLPSEFGIHFCILRSHFCISPHAISAPILPASSLMLLPSGVASLWMSYQSSLNAR